MKKICKKTQKTLKNLKKTLEFLLILYYYVLSSLPKLNMEIEFMIYGVLEMEIMNSIWSLHEKNEDSNISVADIVESLGNNEIERAYTTIKTVMDRLVSKDILVRYKDGKKFFYRSTIDRNEAAKQSIEEVSNLFFNGNQIQMLRFIEQGCETVLV